ncbi:ABC transporter substrate binding protein [Clostridium botulinum]|uniref:ABC transporter substrate binding protein n=2 Tax=Clostridium botulinum TaxID=1491 RepID=UPI001E4DB378|nr:ABC transporter substrate binding protein [Clostridium botulinum]MCD3275103.1 PAS domain S-box protein [Clostridium botulinum C/D]MCD3286959.1 PAS domain S-box protein [Clostridium botulinum C/D]MCD3290167.1 PAS domain S-box protein [Clostridium botulinum C/D]MCD3303686.1 PAS domain S-box protein [Clostridium botulinum C/D]
MRDLKLNNFFYIIFFAFFIMFSYNTKAFAHEHPQKRILIINSYDKLVKRSEDILDSIMPILKSSSNSLDIDIEYMNTESFNSDEYIENLYTFYNKKFINKHFDLILSIDDDAFNFLKKYSKSLFPNTPIVFSGVTNFDKSMLNDLPMFTGITENPAIKETIDVALSLDNNIKNIIILLDDKRSISAPLRKSLNSIIPSYKGKLNFMYLNDTSKLNNKDFIKKHKKNSIVLLLRGFTTTYSKSVFIDNDTFLSPDDFSIPIFSVWETLLDHGIIGGKMLSAKVEGKTLGRLALEILKGKKPKDIPIQKQPQSGYIFDYNMLIKYDIPITLAPKHASFINLKSKSYTIPKMFIWLFIIFLITLISFLIISLFEKHHTRNALIESEKRLRILINAFPDLICLKDGNGHWLEINESTIKFFNLKNVPWKNKTTQNIINTLTHKNIYENRLKRYEHFDNIALMRKTIVNYQDEFCLANGEKIVLDIFKVPIFDCNNNLTGMVTIGHDLTAHIKAEENSKLLNEMLEYQKLRVEFFANISHELKTPLNLILSAVQYVELVNNKNFDFNSDSFCKYTNIIKQNSYRLVRIVNNIIDITKIDSGYFQIHPENYNIVELVEDICLYCASYIHSKDLDFIFDTETEEKIISCDALIMERIILNLLSNAIKFTQPGGRITVNIYDKDNEIQISVKDTGIGIPENRQDLIFERFIQVDKSLSRNHEGSGVGLSLVKAFVDLHNGSIEVKSKVGHGSEFLITLPVSNIANKDIKIFSDVTPYEFRSEKINIEFSDIY